MCRTNIYHDGAVIENVEVNEGIISNLLCLCFCMFKKNYNLMYVCVCVFVCNSDMHGTTVSRRLPGLSCKQNGTWL